MKIKFTSTSNTRDLGGLPLELGEWTKCPLFTQPDTLAEMLSPTLTFSGTTIPRICHGLFSQRYGVTLIGQAGNTTGFPLIWCLIRRIGQALL